MGWAPVLLLAAACGGTVVPSPPAVPVSCRLVTGASQPDTVVVGVSQPVDLDHAPVPLTEAERLVFAPFYETLVRVDCDGHLLPGLAARWSRVEDEGGHWRFTLRDDAHYWDGTLVTAGDIASAWRGNPAVPADSVAALDARTLDLVFARADTVALRGLADPQLAISRASPAGSAPLGTGPFAITSWTAGRIQGRAVDQPARNLAFRLTPGADPRDLLEQGVDAVVTDDPAVLAYARSREGFEVVPLPWAWTYVLAGPLADVAGAGEVAGEIVPEAVRGEARPAVPPFWWTGAERCGETGGGAPDRAAGERRIAYSAGDPVARDIAGRLVALAAAGQAFAGAGRLTAAAAGPEGGAAWGSVLAVPRQSYRSCLNAPVGAVVPLLDGRSSLVARRGRVSVELEWDGTPRLVWP